MVQFCNLTSDSKDRTQKEGSINSNLTAVMEDNRSNCLIGCKTAAAGCELFYVQKKRAPESKRTSGTDVGSVTLEGAETQHRL